MAGKGRSRERVEPSFGDFHESGDDLRLDASERISGTAKQSPKKPKQASRRPKTKNEKRARGTGRGATGFIRSLVYWCIVLGIWGGIGIAGLVLYYGARMPSASSWSIPERPPNVKIVSVNGSVLANR
ncbi:MAG TPA: penicillin-binding protein, partial [Agrobacterium sp.]|nr:penicillin-binding protein [Agrobacterium sp.]